MANTHLEHARSLALTDSKYYPSLMPGVLPLIGPNSNASLEVQRFGADFLAEMFASPMWSAEAKQPIALLVLDTLKYYLDEVHDRGVIKGAVQAAASVYPLVYRHTISDPNDKQHWQTMIDIKSNILNRMNTAPPGVRICCVKFVQQVVLVQTPGVIDPRRPDHSDVSLALVPRDHPLLTYVHLEAEGHGLLDRLLDIIHGDHSDALLVTSVLNSLGVLIHRRPVVANKVLNSVLNFNPLKLANSPMTPKNKVSMKAIERTTRALLVNILKRNTTERPNDPNNGRIQHFLERMHRMRHDIMEESSRKRPAPAEPTNGLDPAKRQRLAAEPPTLAATVPPLPPGPVSYRQLYTIDPENAAANFDVKMFQDPALVQQILIPILQSIDEKKLLEATNVVRSRYLTLSHSMSRQQPLAPVDEDEYEPDDYEPEDAEQVANRLDSTGDITHVAPAAFKLPEAPRLSVEEVQQHGELAVRRTFGLIGELEEKGKATKGGFNRLAASDYGRDAWITIATRLATRASAGLDDPNDGIKDEYAVKNIKGSLSVSESIRDLLYDYVIRDWKKRIDVAVSWLNEEWYNDAILAQTAAASSAKSSTNGITPPKGHYHRCALRLIDGILPYVAPQDKGLIRLYSELPTLDYEILSRMKTMAQDPERVGLATQVLQYLHMFRPPVKDVVVQIAAELWRENDRAKPKAGQLLKVWRPEVLAEAGGGEVKMEEANGNGNGNAVVEVQAAA
ncbi:hypothetical protein DPSP01_007208 [Paraphaeosphaeria sporulosa]|uniref:Symplekin/Pta1 N-terminal domain-containing protein n=1 Tax=Paraphaeosphaeria sporulosa TaxID=1460663 RepID=A0A177CMT4_9PLEO|nr:uncharacterized protein CC84DRAFT_592788 [Paraphaeosphaeria sporulosa]OAG08844.1 hypothetical protein CC84DRAFT_592788 [Paraphaeosphaeria sporulosa]